MNHEHNHGHEIASNPYDSHDKHSGHSPAMFKRKFWASLALTFPAVMFSPTIQDWLGISLGFPGSDYLPAILGVVIFGYGGLIFLKGARDELSARRPGMMTLVSMAITVAFAYSLLVTLRVVDGMDFWWELSTLVTIMLLGHWLEMVSVQSARSALGELAKLLPDEAEVIDGDEILKKPVKELSINDTVLIRPGGQIPADGEIIKGKSDVNESMLTGESKPVTKTAGLPVIGGTINGSGSLTVKVTKVGADTALAGIMKLVADAQASGSSAQILADKIASYLTYIAIGAALITWAAWWLAGAEPSFILERVVTVLVIACPHALGLATPLVTAISTTLAAKNGLLVRERIALETARNIDVVLFDKTGTLTKGEQGVVGIIGNQPERIITLAAALEQESEHPIARAITSYAAAKDVKKLPTADFSALSGRGVRATIDGKEVYAGGPQMISELGASIDEQLQADATAASNDGKTVIFIIDDNSVLGAIALADVIRDESKEAIATLQAMGKRVAMLTGDSVGVAKWVASELKIKEFFAQVLPQNKAATVTQLQADGSKVAMVGDGVNDAPALTQADIGIAIGAGTDIAIESAGVVLVSSDPNGVAKTIALSTNAYRKMVQNITWAIGYNAIAIPLAAGATASIGFVLSPALGAILMSASTIIVAINAQLLRKMPLS